MKTIIKSGIIILVSAVSAVIFFLGLKFGVPILETELSYAKSKPTIDSISVVVNSQTDSISVLQEDLSKMTQRYNAAKVVTSSQSKKNASLDAKIRKMEQITKILSEMSEEDMDEFIKLYDETWTQHSEK